MRNDHIKNIGGLLLATFFISTSGVLGKYIAMPTEIIIWCRAFLAMIFLGIYLKINKESVAVKSPKHRLPFLFGGILMAMHWVTYFYALKLSNVAIGMLSLFTFPVLIAFLEPLFFKVKFNPIHLFFGLLVFTGLYILSPEFSLDNSSFQGVIFGLISAVSYAIRILILKKYVGQYNGVLLMFYQTVIVAVCLFPFLFIKDVSDIQSQLPYLIILGLVTTAIGHSLMVHSLKFFSATTTGIIGSIQPIFGIILAALFLGELPNTNTYIGGGLILAAVCIESIRSKK